MLWPLKFRIRGPKLLVFLRNKTIADDSGLLLVHNPFFRTANKQTHEQINKTNKQKNSDVFFFHRKTRLLWIGVGVRIDSTSRVNFNSGFGVRFSTPTLHQTGQMEEDSKRWLILLRCCFVSLFFAFLFDSTSNFLFVSDFLHSFMISFIKLFKFFPILRVSIRFFFVHSAHRLPNFVQLLAW